jgi:hypothetical protein
MTLKGLSVAATVAVALVLAPSAQAAGRVRLKLPPLSPALAGAPGARIHDTVVTRHRRVAHAAQAPSGGVYTTGDGYHPTVLLSPAYAPNPSAGQALADFFGTLIHGAELNSLTVYVAPLSEMQTDCGSADADSCYDALDDTIYLVGETPPDGATIPELAAHEYGHHIANHRDNYPWDAADWGPKYWATAEDVCMLAREGVAYPGDEDKHYDVNPGEAWAETYRVLNGKNPFSWPILSDLFAPDQKSLDAARRDVVQPWGGDQGVAGQGRLSRRHARRVFRLPVQNDGTIDVRLRSRGSLNASLFVYGAGSRRPLAKAVRGRRRARISGAICGVRRIRVAVVRRKGSGAFTLRTTLPYTNTAT